MTGAAPRKNILGGAWLVADMSLNIWALSIVKWLGADYPATTIVFFRALVGLALIAPAIWLQRDAFRKLDDLPFHALRVGLSVITLTASFFAIARVPLATFTAIGFTRPIVTMIMAALILREGIGLRRWIAAAVAFVGVVIGVNPATVPMSWGLLALCVVVLTGSGAVIATRHLRNARPIVMMAFYTVGLALCTAPFVLLSDFEINQQHLPPLLLVGVFAQAAQWCFLRAHYHGEAGFLSVLSFLSLVLSVGVGYLVFDEIPGEAFMYGAILIVGAALWTTHNPGTRPEKKAREVS